MRRRRSYHICNERICNERIFEDKDMLVITNVMREYVRRRRSYHKCNERICEKKDKLSQM